MAARDRRHRGGETLAAGPRTLARGSGHFPKPIGAANTTGTSRYFAREDHIHRGATDTHTHAGPAARRAPVTLADAATITTDAARGDYFRVSLGGNRTLVAPTNGTDGQRILIETLASGAQRTLTLDTSILLSTGITPPITIPSGKRWFGDLVYIDTVGWVIVTSTVQS